MKIEKYFILLIVFASQICAMQQQPGTEASGVRRTPNWVNSSNMQHINPMHAIFILNRYIPGFYKTRLAIQNDQLTLSRYLNKEVLIFQDIHGSLDIIELLLIAGANPNHNSEVDGSLILTQMLAKIFYMTHYLPDPKKSSPKERILEARKLLEQNIARNIASIKLLIDFKADPKLIDQSIGKSPIEMLNKDIYELENSFFKTEETICKLKNLKKIQQILASGIKK